ncbi:MAG: NUDIX domain-containing protein, partial [Planctomycetota bacterium]
RVEPGEDFIAAAKRETLEEAGIPIEVTGIVRIEHTPIPQGTRMRLIVTARPINDSPPKSIADEESLEARWFTFHELHHLALRGDDVLAVFDYLEQGGEVAPLTILSREGKPFC